MRVIYTGPHDGVEVPMPDGQALTIERGGELVTTTEHGTALLEQAGNWTAAPGARPGVSEKKRPDTPGPSAAESAEGGD